jgi:hypothetical protein
MKNNCTCQYETAKQFFKPAEIQHNHLCLLTNLISIAKRELLNTAKNKPLFDGNHPY